MKTTVINKYILLYNSCCWCCLHIIYSTRFYVVMWHQILYFLQNLVIPPTRRGAPRRDLWKAESPMKRLCLPLSANALAVVGTHGLGRFHDERKMSNETRNRRSLYCSSSSHQKSVSADGQIKTQQAPSPSSPEPTS